MISGTGVGVAASSSAGMELAVVMYGPSTVMLLDVEERISAHPPAVALIFVASVLDVIELIPVS
jgi:hypothetical protein